jgi:gamma-glutamyltranspeptidase/glutathione hydrolase
MKQIFQFFARRVLSLVTIGCLILNVSCKSALNFHPQINNQVTEKQASNLSDRWISEAQPKKVRIPLVKSQKFMVVSGSKLANQAAKEILDKNGSAVDAAIAAELVLNVVEPQYSGIGGGGLMLYYDAKNKQSVYFNGRETAPALVHSRMFLDKKGNPQKFEDVVKGGLSVGTPGLLKMLKEAHDRYGKLPWKDLFTPAITIAKEGFAVSERLNVTSSQLPYLKEFSQTAKIYLKKDRNGKYNIRKVGEIITNKELSKTLTIIANHGIEPFYSGKISRDIVKAVKESKINPGYLRENDFKNYQVKIGEPICIFYRQKYKICSSSIPSGGITLLQILGILENFNLSKYKPTSFEAIHIISEATRLAYADRNYYISDSENVLIKELLNKNYLKNRSNLIKMDSTIKNVKPGQFKHNLSKRLVLFDSKELPSTTHLSVIDSEGNAVSLTSTIEYYFGSALSVDGFLLNNQLTDFSFIDEIKGRKVANRVAAGKQPRSSMSPTFVFDQENNLIMVVGSPGGPRIIQFVLQAILANLDWHLNVEEAVSLPHYIALQEVLELEKDTKLNKIAPKLNELDYHIKIIDIVSGINAIIINKNGLEGAADPRRLGAEAIGE